MHAFVYALTVLFLHFQLSFTQWLDWELWVDCEDDFLHHYERSVLIGLLRNNPSNILSQGGLLGKDFATFCE